MTYDKLIETVSEIYNNDNILKEGLVVEYNLPEPEYKAIEEYFYYKYNNAPLTQIVHIPQFEVEIGGILVRFTRI